jgi:hypothetical protein
VLYSRLNRSSTIISSAYYLQENEPLVDWFWAVLSNRNNEPRGQQAKYCILPYALKESLWLCC